MIRELAFTAAAAGWLAAGPAWAEFLPSPPAKVIDLQTRPGVTVRYAAFAPDGQPRAVAILFVGGQGALRIPDQPGPNWQNPGNFLSRSRENFRRRGFFVIVVDAPSDYSGRGMVGGFRSSADHAKDLAVVIADARRRVPDKPVWLIGTSRGSISAANVAARLQGAQDADGVVLTSSVTRNAMGANAPSRDAVFDVDLAAIHIPVLVVSHRGDTCDYSSPAEQPRLVSKLVNAPRKELLMVQGGDPPRGDACEPYAAHGYIGMEDEVVGAIADWILSPKS